MKTATSMAKNYTYCIVSVVEVDVSPLGSTLIAVVTQNHDRY
jgi:hypothetical protein